MEQKCLEFKKLSEEEIALIPEPEEKVAELEEVAPEIAVLGAIAPESASVPEEIASVAAIAAVAGLATAAAVAEDKDPEINVPEASKSTDSSSDSSESESDVDVSDDEYPGHRNLCCKCCKLKFNSTIRMINWPFLICMTLATVLAGMSIGSALFNDGPIANII